MDDLPTWVSLVNALSPGGLATLIFLLVATGWLIPRKTLPILIEERDQRLRDLRTEADRWRQASELRDQELSALREQVGLLEQQGELTVALLQALKNQAG